MNKKFAENRKTVFGEFYRRLVAHGPELIGHAKYYEAVKNAVEEAAAEFRHIHKLRPERRLEWLERCTEKWFGASTPETPPQIPPCYGDPLTLPECQLCHLLEKCCLEATHR